MKFKELNLLNREILSTRESGPRQSLLPVINTLLISQKYLIVSSDPSLETDKTKSEYDKHSAFEERVIALIFFGLDNDVSVGKVRKSYSSFKAKFLSNFYWTHYSKTYARGSPGNFWAQKFLLKEIELFEPQVIVVFGNVVASFLFGPGKLSDRVNHTLSWQGFPLICSLHPSRDWNLKKRPQYKFAQTWKLIRKRCPIT